MLGTATNADLRVRADAAELSGVRTFVGEAADSFGFRESERHRFVFAANEAVANAIEHGEPCPDGSVGVQVVEEGNRLALYVSDCGTFQPPRPEADPLAERGRGLALIAGMADDFELRPDAGQTVIKLAVRRRRLG